MQKDSVKKICNGSFNASPIATLEYTFYQMQVLISYNYSNIFKFYNHKYSFVKASFRLYSTLHKK